MGMQRIGKPSDEPVAEHRAVMAYIESPEWESRLNEARLKRQVVLAARATAEALQRGQELKGVKPRPPKPDHVAFISQPQTHLPVKNALKSDSLLRAALKTEAPRRSRHPLMRPILGALAGFGMFGMLTVGSLLWFQPGEVGDKIILDEDAATRGRLKNSVLRGQRDDPFATVTHQSSLKDPGGAKPIHQPVSFDSLASALREFSKDYQITIVTTANRHSSIAQLNYEDGSSVKVRTTIFETPRPVVVYFHDADAAAAVRFSARIEGEAMDLRGLLPSPPTGTLEVLLAGS